MDRDYIQDMNEAIDEATSGSGWSAGVVAGKLAARLAETDPGLLDGWLRTCAVAILTEAVGARLRSQAGAARRGAQRQAFARAARDAEAAGDYSRLPGMFSAAYVVDTAHTRRRARDMTGRDHQFVAAGYTARAEENSMLAHFHREVARRVGDRVTSEVFDEETYERMYRSITGEDRLTVTRSRK